MITASRELMPVIQAALGRGQNVRLTVNGASMLPFIHDGDTVELEPALSPPKPGDLVLTRTSGERYVLHRVTRIDGGKFWLRGDAQYRCEGPISFSNIVGRVIVSERAGRSRAHDRGVWRLAGLIWNRGIPWTLWLLRLVIRTRQIGGRVLRRMHIREVTSKNGAE
jgi:hypothetical protein